MQISHEVNIRSPYNDRQANYTFPVVVSGRVLLQNMRMATPPHYLKQWRKFRGYTQDQVAGLLEVYADRPENAGKDIATTQATVQRVESGKHKYHQHMMEALAEIYGTTVSDLINIDPAEASGGAQKSDTSGNLVKNKESINFDTYAQKSVLQTIQITHNVPVLGIVEAGAFREMYAVGEPTAYIPLSVPEYRGIKLSAYEVAGDSMNEVFPEGTRVITASPHDWPLHEGNYVVLRRHSHGLAETSLKKLFVDDEGEWEFRPCSTNPVHKPIIAKPFDEFEQDGLEILAIVLFEAPKQVWKASRPVLFGVKA